MNRAISRAQGFTLIEIAVVLVIVGLLLGGLLLPLGTQQEARRIGATQEALDEAREALFGYAVANGSLPCPDTDNDGVEDPLAGACNAQEGELPWATLGTPGNDAVAGNRFRYRVASAYNDHATIDCGISGDIDICTAATGGSDCSAGTEVALNVAAVVLSHGKNGFGATNRAGNALPAPTAADEVENADTDPVFVSRAPTGADAQSGLFDDVVTYVPSTLLCSRLIRGGTL